jgi:hypothetical protein
LTRRRPAPHDGGSQPIPEVDPVRRRRLPAALLSLVLATLVVPPGLASAQGDQAPAGVTLTLEPVGDGTVTGLAVLTPRDADTAANVLAVGAPAGTIAVIHAGTCAAVDPAPVGLLGDVGTTGQLGSTIPVSFGIVADGMHVLALHAGLDLTTAIACGAIPRAAFVAPSGALTSAVPSMPVRTVAPTVPPTVPPSPSPDTACAGVDAWVTGTLARFDAVKAMGDDLASAMNAGMADYAQALADTSVAIQRLQIEQQQAAVPATAADAQEGVIKMLQKLVEAYDLMSQAYTTGNTAVLQQGLGAASEAQGLATSARTAIREVALPCGITVPAA